MSQDNSAGDVLKSVKGMPDLAGATLQKILFLEQTARQIFPLYGYAELRTPSLEYASLFSHGLGEASEVVNKQMFLIENQEPNLALRPEGTAPVVRYAIQNQLLRQQTLARFFYAGSMFRYERPQKGRYRQFHQIGGECFGSASPSLDLEQLLLLKHYFAKVGLDVEFKINSIGCTRADCREAYLKKLVQFLEPFLKSQQLCKLCEIRLQQSPLRVFDCKVAGCKQVLQTAPKIPDHLCPECSEHFAQLLNLLEQQSIDYSKDPNLVRGFDYYTKTVFEVYTNKLTSAQNAIAGGGRYDGLFESYQAPKTSAIGFALGVERLGLVLDYEEPKLPTVFVICQDEQQKQHILHACRQVGFKALGTENQASLKSQFKKANRLAADWVIIFEEQEQKSAAVSIKNMQNSEQYKIRFSALAEHLAELYRLQNS